MKRFTYILGLVLLSCLPIIAQESKPKETEVERSIKNCSVMLSLSLDMVFNEVPLNFNPKPYADTLYRELYADPADVSLNLKCIGKIPLQAYYIITNDSRVDYKEIEKVLATTQKYPAFRTLPYLICAFYFGSFIEETNADKALAAYLLAADAHDRVYKDKVSTFSSLIYSSLASNYMNRKDWKKAAVYQKRCVDDFEKSKGNGSEEYREQLASLAFFHKMAVCLERSDSCYSILQQMAESKGDVKSEEYTEIICERLDIATSLGDKAKAESSLRILGTLAVPSNPLYLDILLEEANYYEKNCDYEATAAITRKAVDHLVKENSDDVEQIQQWLSLANNPGSQNESRKLLKLIQSKLPNNDIPLLCLLSKAYAENGDFLKSNEISKRVESLYSSMRVEEYLDAHDFICGMYLAQHDFMKALEYSKTELESVEEVYGHDHEMYLNEAMSLAEIRALGGEYYKALEELDSCLSHKALTKDIMRDIYAQKAGILFSLGDYEKAASLAAKIADITTNGEQKYAMQSLNVVSMICELDLKQSDINEKKSTEEERMQVVNLAKSLYDNIKATYGDHHEKTIDASRNLASAYFLYGDTLAAMNIVGEMEKTLKATIKNKNRLAEQLDALVPYYLMTKNFKHARSLIDTSALGISNASPMYLGGTLNMLAGISLGERKYAEAQKYYKRMAELNIKDLSTQMFTLTASARQQYWRKNRQEMLNAARYANEEGKPSEYAETIYDMALYSKSLLLNSDNAFRQSILSTGDADLISKLNILNNLRSGNDNANHDEVSVQRRTTAETLEKELLADARVNKSVKKQSTWKDVKNVLPENAIAVEFLEYQDLNEKARYGAVMLRKKWTEPVFVQIGMKDAIDEKLKSAMSSYDFQMENVWAFIKPYANEGDKVYFSPVGCYHTTPIESFADASIYEMHRLTSTAEIVNNSRETIGNTIAFGGIKYDVEVDSLIKEQAKYGTERALDIEHYAVRQSAKGASYLPGTAKEVLDISFLLNQKSENKAKAYLGGEATEALFKRLDGANTNIIHVATHGFAQPVRTNNRFFGNNQKLISPEDAALLQTGLLFAGANLTLKGKKLPINIDDGILTAKEISTLNFKNLDLVVLSACETGKGEITGDGVYGLQRGFKLAGARSIIMSLWKVDDEATSDLMVEFYRNVASGCSFYESLEKAKKEIKSHERWQDPRYWAAFILLDGM